MTGRLAIGPKAELRLPYPLPFASKSWLWQAAKALLLWVLWLLVLWQGLATANKVAALQPATSLRYSEGIPAFAAENARRGVAGAVAKGESVGWPTFWSEDTLLLESELFSQNASVLYYDGEPALIYPTPDGFATGRYPGAFEQGGAAVSTQLAWHLWGGNNVVGRTFTACGKEYTVTGVFHGDDTVALLNLEGSAPENGWQAVELDGVEKNKQNTAADDFTTASGIAPPSTVVQGSAFSALCRFLALLPAAGLAIWWLLRAYNALGLSKRTKTLLLLLAGLAFALALPTLLNLLPPWLLPSKWSDFSHFVSLWQSMVQGVKGYLLLSPALRDGAVRLLLLWQAALFAAALPLTFLLCRIDGAKSLR